MADPAKGIANVVLGRLADSRGMRIKLVVGHTETL